MTLAIKPKLLRYPKNILDMNSAQISESIHDSTTIWMQLKDLNDNTKLELIALLSNSLLHSESDVKNSTDWTVGFAGKWRDERSSDEIIQDIRAARTSNTIDLNL